MALDVSLQVMTLDAFTQIVSSTLYLSFFRRSWVRFPALVRVWWFQRECNLVSPQSSRFVSTQIQCWSSNPTCHVVPTWWVSHPCRATASPAGVYTPGVTSYVSSSSIRGRCYHNHGQSTFQI